MAQSGDVAVVRLPSGDVVEVPVVAVSRDGDLLVGLADYDHPAEGSWFHGFTGLQLLWDPARNTYDWSYDTHLIVVRPAAS